MMMKCGAWGGQVGSNASTASWSRLHHGCSLHLQDVGTVATSNHVRSRSMAGSMNGALWSGGAPPKQGAIAKQPQAMFVWGFIPTVYTVTRAQTLCLLLLALAAAAVAACGMATLGLLTLSRWGHRGGGGRARGQVGQAEHALARTSRMGNVA